MSTNKKPIENWSDTEVYAQLKEYLNNKKSYTYSINNLEHFSTTIPVLKEDVDIKDKKYRPFESAEECWEEMKKHKPFGYIQEEGRATYAAVVYITRFNIETFDNCYNYKHAASKLFFVDGTPFGKEIE